MAHSFRWHTAFTMHSAQPPNRNWSCATSPPPAQPHPDRPAPPASTHPSPLHSPSSLAPYLVSARPICHGSNGQRGRELVTASCRCVELIVDPRRPGHGPHRRGGVLEVAADLTAPLVPIGRPPDVIPYPATGGIRGERVGSSALNEWDPAR